MIAIGHFVWAILAVLFVFSLIGVAHSSQTINIENLKDSDMATAITGKGFWLIGVTLAESAITRMDYNWLWTGLLFCLMVCIISLYYYVKYGPLIGKVSCFSDHIFNSDGILIGILLMT